MIYDIYDSCDTLPAIRFDKISKTNDLRYLLICKKLPVYNQQLLIPIWRRITDEYDRISGLNLFKRNLEDNKELTIEYNRIVGLKSSLILMRINDSRCIKMLEYWDYLEDKININSVFKLKNYILREESRITIESWRDQSIEDFENTGKESIIRAMVTAENVLNRSIDKHKVTVTEWLYIQKDVNTIITQRSKNRKNGNS